MLLENVHANTRILKEFYFIVVDATEYDTVFVVLIFCSLLLMQRIAESLIDYLGKIRLVERENDGIGP